jgi:hypothetical protein
MRRTASATARFRNLHRRRAMVETITVETIDGALGVVFTKALLERLQIAEGDTFLVSVKDWGLLLTRSVSVSQRVSDFDRRGAAEYRNALRELAGPDGGERSRPDIPLPSEDDLAAGE